MVCSGKSPACRDWSAESGAGFDLLSTAVGKLFILKITYI